MELVTTIINTVLLLALFWYQRNKNRVLEDRIKEQSSLLKETKDVVTNQAQAIESQKKVVDTALEYSNNFDMGKIESIIKREVGLEYKETIEEQKEKIAKHEQSLEKATETLKKTVDYSVEHTTSSYIVPLSSELYGFLLTASKERREEVLSKIPEAISNSFRSSLEEFDKNSRPSLLGLLGANGSSKKDAEGNAS
jgi:uncharacterized coiled-coil protein SlyX